MVSHPTPLRPDGPSATTNRIARLVENARFSLEEQTIFDDLKRRANVRISDYGAPKMPRRTKLPLRERKIRSGEQQLAAEIKQLINRDGSKVKTLEQLLQHCIDNDGVLSPCHDQLQQLLVQSQAVSMRVSGESKEIELEGIAEFLNEATANLWAKRVNQAVADNHAVQESWARSTAQEILHSLTVDRLRITDTYADMGPAVIGHEQINKTSDLKRLFELAQEGFDRKAEAIAASFVSVVRRGLEEEIFFDGPKGLGQTSQTFCYLANYILHDSQPSAISQRRETTVNAITTRTVKAVIVTHLLIKGRLYSFQEMLHHPGLRIPSRYRNLLTSVPSVLHSQFSGLFGTQAGESRRLLSKQMTEHSQTTVFQNTVVRHDPAIMWAGFVLAAYGEESMNELSDRQKLARKQRKILNAVARQSGYGITFLLTGLAILAVMAAQFAVAGKTLSASANLATSLPGVACGVVFLALSVLSFVYARINSVAEHLWRASALNRMARKYAGFDATDPILIEKEERAK